MTNPELKELRRAARRAQRALSEDPPITDLMRAILYRVAAGVVTWKKGKRAHGARGATLSALMNRTDPLITRDLEDGKIRLTAHGEIALDPPQLLAPAGHRGTGVHADDGYTDDERKALPEEPEAIDVDDLSLAWKRGAEERHAAAEPRSRRRKRSRDLGRGLRS